CSSDQSAWTLGWLHLEDVSLVIAFFPAGLLNVRRAVLRASLGWAALAAAVLAWLLVSTHLLFALVTWCLCLAYGAALALWPLVAPGALRDRRPRALVGRAARLAGTTLGSLGLAAPVLLPTWLMLSASQRTPLDYAELEATSLGEPSTFLHTF